MKRARLLSILLFASLPGLSAMADTRIVFPSSMSSLLGRNFVAQDAAPTAPATGDLWYETDDNFLWYYDGTQWLSDQVFSIVQGVGGASATTGGTYQTPAMFPTTYNIWLKDFQMTSFSGVNTSVNYWEVQLRAIKSDNTFVSPNPAVISLQSVTNTTWAYFKTAVNAAKTLDTNFVTLRIDATMFGTPPALYCGVTLTYRLIHP